MIDELDEILEKVDKDLGTSIKYNLIKADEDEIDT
jgi:hypothetical protein